MNNKMIVKALSCYIPQCIQSLGCSKCFILYPWQTCSIKLHLGFYGAREDYPNTTITTVYSQVFIHTAEWHESQ